MHKKLTYIISNVDKAISFEWIVENIDISKFDISFILINPTPQTSIQSYLSSKKIDFIYIPYCGKKNLLLAIWKTFNYLSENKIDIIHCHLFEASFIGLLAGKLAGVRKRIFTRHHSTSNHTYYPKKVYQDRVINFLATHIVSISKNVSNILINKEQVSPSKITLIHHGFRLSYLSNPNQENIKKLGEKYKTKGFFPVIGVIARYTHLKGIQYIIPAFKQILVEHPNAKLILANAKGDYSNEIKQLLKTIPENNYTEIVFENDFISLYSLFDIYVHTPINDNLEAFGQTYVEALATGTPSVFTLSGVANEFIKNEYNALVVDYQNTEQIETCIKRILTNVSLKNQIVTNGEESINGLFTLQKMIYKLENLYGK